MKRMEIINSLLSHRGLVLTRPEDLMELESRRFVGELLKAYQIDLVIDVGANHGQFRDSIVGAGWAGQVISFEPVPEYFRILETRRSPNWDIYNYALGSNNGQIEMTVFDSPGLASIREADISAMEDLLPRHSVKVEGKRAVEIRRLDEFLENIGTSAKRIFLKMDTQGFDLEVFRGGSKIMSRVSAIQTELSFLPIYKGAPGYQDVLGEIGRSGFEVAALFPVTRDESLRVIEMDCLMVRSA